MRRCIENIFIKDLLFSQMIPFWFAGFIHKLDGSACTLAAKMVSFLFCLHRSFMDFSLISQVLNQRSTQKMFPDVAGGWLI